MMRLLFSALLLVHGLIHFLGFAKAFELAKLPALTLGISRGQGLTWALTGLLLLSSALLLALSHRQWWLPGLAGVILSQVLVVFAWQDAKAGTLPNLLLLPGLLYGLASQGPWSFGAQYLRRATTRLARPAHPVEGASLVTPDDLAPLPAPLRRYLQQVGVVGQPRVHHFRARWRGRIRGGPSEAWMAFSAEQINIVDEPARFFWMQARRAGVPVDVLHVFAQGAATMGGKLLSAVPLVHASGPDLTRAETVTLFNDLCLLAPAALLDSRLSWEPLEERSVRGQLCLGANTVSAVLHFGARGELVNFVSDDRLVATPDGFAPRRWSTPVGHYRRFGPYRVFSEGRALWHAEGGAYPYFEAELMDLEVNGPAPGAPDLRG